jgi:hypothetical protein
MRPSSSVIELAQVRAERHAESLATALVADLAIIQDRPIGYFHLDTGNPATDLELGAAGLLRPRGAARNGCPHPTRQPRRRSVGPLKMWATLLNRRNGQHLTEMMREMDTLREQTRR